MLILLPPSETKTRPHSEAPALDLGSLSCPELNAQRLTCMRAAMRTASMPDGGKLLGAPASASHLVERMARIDEEPVARALDVYTGVLFDALGPVRPQDNPNTQVFVTSALFGLVDCARDAIPAYRVSAGSQLSRLGKAGTWWRKHLSPWGRRLADSASVIIDARSGAYRSMMPLRGAHVLDISPVAERDGVRTVISHDAKRYRGLIARALIEAPSTPSSVGETVDYLTQEFRGSLDVELSSAQHTSVLTVVDRWEQGNPPHA